jgi:peptidoglycan hydrolase-like protein with peptidoglycan-binding domain
MSDIALLMTGVIATGQPSSPPVLPEQPLLELDDSVEQSTLGKLSQSVPTAQMTPPEFMQPNQTMVTAPPAKTTQGNGSGQVSSIDIDDKPFHEVSYETYIKNIHQKRTDLFLNSAALRANIVRNSDYTSFSSTVNHSDIKQKTSNESSINQQKSASKAAEKIELIRTQDSDNSKSITKLQKPTSSPMPTLLFGDSGVCVRVLQRLLLSNGYAIQVDGTFGALTETAVKTFQYRRNLLVDGIVGQKTWYELTK